MLSRLSTVSLTGQGPSSLSFLPDDRQHAGMETETVALLPVLRRLEICVGGMGAAQALSGLRLLLEHLSLRSVQPTPVMSVGEEIEPGQQPLSEKIGKKFVAEGGLPLVLTLLMSGSGNLETNPRPAEDNSVRL